MAEEDHQRRGVKPLEIMTIFILMILLAAMAYYAYQILFLPGFSLGGMAE